MPRLTHPRRRRKHPRAHTRAQRDRYVARRWRQAKDRYDLGRLHPELTTRRVGPDRQARLDSEAQWPFYLPPGCFARNLFTRCSCSLCAAPKSTDPRRARERRAWTAEAQADIDR